MLLLLLLLLLLLMLVLLVVHGHGRGKRLGTCLVLKLCALCVVSLQHVSVFHYTGGARAWTRQGLGTCLVVKPCASCFASLQHVSVFDYASGARPWTRQARWYVLCGEVVCAVCHEFPTCVHASLYVFRQKSLDIYIIYFCPKKV